MANYWNRRKNRPTILNPSVHKLMEVGARIEKQLVPLRRIQAIGNNAAIFHYGDLFKVYESTDPFAKLVEEAYIAKTQQAVRLRFNDGRLRVIYLFDKRFFPGLLITDPVVEDELLGFISKE